METKKMHGWVIDDHKHLRENNAEWLEMEPIMVNGVAHRFTDTVTFPTVDAALSKFETLSPKDYPDFIITDGETNSTLDGLDLARRMKGSGIGVLVNSGADHIEEKFHQGDFKGARFLKKLDFDEQRFYQLISEAISAAKAEKRLSGGLPNVAQQSPYSGGRF